jgi:hypothetical protein
MGTLAAELSIVLEGRFTIPQAGMQLKQVVFKNHLSWENNQATARATWWLVWAQYLILGQFECVPEGALLPIDFLPISALPKSTFPWWSLILKLFLFKQVHRQLAYMVFFCGHIIAPAQQKTFFCVAAIKASTSFRITILH